MADQKDNTLFIFLDESGNLDFSTSGSKFWSMTAFCTFNPDSGREAFLSILYDLAAAGQGQECFHAATDKQMVRDKVFSAIGGLKDDFEVHCVIAEKKKAHPSLYMRWITRKGKKILVKDPSRFYDLVCRTLLRYIFKRRKYAGATRIVVILSSIFDKQKHDALEGTLKSYLRRHTKVPFTIYFHQNKADVNCQIADYCGWAITIMWEREDPRSYALIKNRVFSQFPIFAKGHTDHY